MEQQTVGRTRRIRKAQARKAQLTRDGDTVETNVNEDVATDAA